MGMLPTAHNPAALMLRTVHAFWGTNRTSARCGATFVNTACGCSYSREGWTLSEQAPIAQAITCFACNGLPVDRKWFERAGYHRHDQ
jgi:hypothetical protein